MHRQTHRVEEEPKSVLKFRNRWKAPDRQRQTDKQTDAQTRTASFLVGGTINMGGIIFFPYEKTNGVISDPLLRIEYYLRAPTAWDIFPGRGHHPGPRPARNLWGEGGRAHPANVPRQQSSEHPRQQCSINPYMRSNIRLLGGPTSVYLNCLRDCTVSEVIK